MTVHLHAHRSVAGLLFNPRPAKEKNMQFILTFRRQVQLDLSSQPFHIIDLVPVSVVRISIEKSW